MDKKGVRATVLAARRRAREMNSGETAEELPQPPEEQTLTTATTSPVYTPSQSSDPDIEKNLSSLSLNKDLIENTTCPWPGRTYTILEKASKRAMTLRDGKIVLIDIFEGLNYRLDVSCHWRCIEDETSRRWGFRNAVSGTYLGLTAFHWKCGEILKISTLVATSNVQLKSQSIYPRQHPDGGYELLINCAECLAPITGEDDATPTRWEFLEVENRSTKNEDLFSLW